MPFAPVLLVHGIWNSARQFAPLVQALRGAGVEHIAAVDLSPNSGHAPIAELAAQLAAPAERLLSQASAAELDVIGFSMAALVTRYWIQRRGGHQKVRRFVSISGPHRGTALALFSRLPGIRDMRPRSRLLDELAGADESWTKVELHCLWTPYDVMIVPAAGSVLAGARSSTRFPVLLHRWMIRDPRVLAAVTAILTAPTA